MCQVSSVIYLVFVKLGQWASTRRDLFPLILCQNLSRLQRQSHVHSWFQTKHLLEEAFGDKFSDVFRDFEKSPVGSGKEATILCFSSSESFNHLTFYFQDAVLKSIEHN